MSDVEKGLKAIGDVTTGGFFSKKEAAKDQRRARRVQQRLQRARAARERRAQVREAIRAQAEVQQSAVVSGANTSAAAQGVGSIQTQLASNLSFLNEQQQGAEAISIFQQRAANDLQRAATSEAIRNAIAQGAEASQQGGNGSSLFGG